MSSFKTGLVVVILLGILFGVYKVLNMPDPSILNSEEEVQIEMADKNEVSQGTQVPGDSLFPDIDDGASLAPSVEIDLPEDTELASSYEATATANDAVLEGVDGLIDPPSGDVPVDRVRSKGDSVPKNAGPPPIEEKRSLGRFERTWQTAEAHIDNGEFQQALEVLTPFYGSPDLTPEQHEQLLSWLDPLAGKVIYSTEHHLKRAHIVKGGETLPLIADKYLVPWRLLYNINRRNVNNPDVLIPGTEVKVFDGPVNAYVDLSNQTLTLFVGSLYAGHFALTLGDGDDHPIVAGKFHVQHIAQGKDYVTRSGQTIDRNDPMNPYGRWVINLGSDVWIHGRGVGTANADGLGCISLSPLDAQDVASILSRGSSVTIRR